MRWVRETTWRERKTVASGKNLSLSYPAEVITIFGKTLEFAQAGRLDHHSLAQPTATKLLCLVPRRRDGQNPHYSQP